MTVLFGVLSLTSEVIGPRVLFAAQVFESAQDAPALLELYSAQECKECPNAEGWIAGLQFRKDLWKTVIPMIFHVRYGAGPGEDPLADRDYDFRLRHYLESWKSTALMLPLLVLDGKPLAYSEDISKALNFSRRSEGKLTAKALDAREFLIRYEPVSDFARRELEIHGVLLGISAPSESMESKREKGFVVLNYRKKSIQYENGAYSSSIILPSKRSDGSQASGVAFWVTESEGTRPLQATGGWIEGESAEIKRDEKDSVG